MLLVFLRFSRLLGGHIKYMKGWVAFKLPHLDLTAQRVKLSEGPEPIGTHGWFWKEIQGSDSQLSYDDLISFAAVCHGPGRHVQPGTATQLTHRCHLNTGLKFQPPQILRSCANLLDSSLALKVVPGVPVWWDTKLYPWLFRHFNWKGICVLRLRIDLAYKEHFCHKIMILPQHCNACRKPQKVF